MDPKVILRGAPGKWYLLLGNEAIARGALENDVRVATTYPGTPASEILDTLSAVAEEAGIYVEYSANEKVALEVAAGSSLVGERSLVAFKHVGFNVALDSIMGISYSGIRGGMAIVSADDPNCYSSQNEQDTRVLAKFANLPLFEPATPQEAKDSLTHALYVSEILELPSVLRLLTRVSHVRGPVLFSGIKQKGKELIAFRKDAARFLMMPPYSRSRHDYQLKNIKRVSSYSEQLAERINSLDRTEYGIITSGIAYNYVMEAIKKGRLKVDVLKLLMLHPPPVESITDFLSSHKKVLIVEEGEPLIENIAKLVKAENDINVKVVGKELIPRVGELTPNVVSHSLMSFMGITVEEPPTPPIPVEVPERPPVLCPGCPHRASLFALRLTLDGPRTVFSDIGCYALGALPPLEVGSLILDMGFSLGGIQGVAISEGKKSVAVIGDSTFIHAGMPALANATHNLIDILVVVLDNYTTAMTGFQPHPGTDVGAYSRPAVKIDIADIARALKASYVRVIDPFDPEVKNVLEEALKAQGASVVVMRHECVLLAKKRGRVSKVAHIIDKAICTECKVCVNSLGCPAFFLMEDGRVVIDRSRCEGCGLCSRVCPNGAIKVGE